MHSSIQWQFSSDNVSGSPREQGSSHCAGSSVRVGSGAVCLVKTNGLLGRIQTHTAVQLEKAVQLGIKQQVMNYKALCADAAVNG